ncbi:MAG: TIGR04283 family arsenosugar biosynthesis glycosyltransferase [Nitrospira sp.]|nr:TIGR04283 family arsenosugar biosynthesis glycosyltransferase [Nitrospira sp.]
MTSRVTISVIIPTLNEERSLPQSLGCLSASDPTEIIIVDGGSTDRTLDLAQEFCARTTNARLITAPRGRASQMNEGAKASQGEVLLFLHADTQLPPQTERIVESALASPSVVGGRFDVRFDNSSAWSQIISAFMNRRSRLTGIATGDQALFVRRDVFEALGGFSEIPLMEDIEFSRRLQQAGRITALRSTVVTSFRRWDTQGPLRTIFLMWTLRFLYWVGVSPHQLARVYHAVR